MGDSAAEFVDLLERLRQGDDSALAALYAWHRPRLLRMVEFRLSDQLRDRVEPDDVLQEAYLAAVQRITHFTGESEVSFFVWLRLIVNQTMIDLYRFHFAAQKRDADRDLPIHARRSVCATSVSIAAQLLGHCTSPTFAARRQELGEKLREALDTLDDIDREVLALRHFEELTNSEVAEELNLTQKAASIRYVRALRRLKDLLTELPGFEAAFAEGI